MRLLQAISEEDFGVTVLCIWLHFDNIEDSSAESLAVLVFLVKFGEGMN